MPDDAEDLAKMSAISEDSSSAAWLALALASLRHEVNNQSARILYLAASLKDKIGTSSESVREELVAMENAAKHLYRVVNIPLPATERPSLRLNEVLTTYARRLSRQISHVKIDSDFASTTEVMVLIDPNWLVRCLDILVNNALEAMELSPQRTLTLHSSNSADKAEVTVTDTGIGLSEEIRLQLLRKPIQRPNQKGLGIGLLIAHNIISQFGGSLLPGRQTEQGQSFTIVLPKA